MDEPDASKVDQTRFQVMRIVAENPNITQRELARLLGVSLGKANYCLAALVRKGQIKVERFRASNTKWRYMYVLTPHGISERAKLTGKFMAIKIREFEMLRAEISALELEQKIALEHESATSKILSNS